MKVILFLKVLVLSFIKRKRESERKRREGEIQERKIVEEIMKNKLGTTKKHTYYSGA